MTAREPVFLGLSHIGQVFSIGWATKVGPCAAFDIDPLAAARFRAGDLTPEEPDLVPAFAAARDRLRMLNAPEAVRSRRLVFLTMDTPIEEDGTPRVEAVYDFIGRAAPWIGPDATVVIPSQVYPGFCARVRTEIFHDRPDVRLVYMVDTLKMGVALPRFLAPEQLIFGVEDPADVPREFDAFGGRRYVVSWAEAEIVKIAINVYLAFGVTFANAMDNYCRRFGVRFAPLVEPLRQDARIGAHAYIAPSLGLSGGHLERDLSTVVEGLLDAPSRRLFESLVEVNASRLELLHEAVKAAGARHVLWVGASYKEASFSLVNSPFLRFARAAADDVRVAVYDSRYLLDRVKDATPVVDLADALARADVVVYNYASAADTETIRRAALTRSSLQVLDISLPAVAALRPAGETPANVRRVF